MLLYVHRDHIIKTIRDGEPRTATSTFTLLLSSVNISSVLLYVHRDHIIKTISEGHLDFHTATELWRKGPFQFACWPRDDTVGPPV